MFEAHDWGVCPEDDLRVRHPDGSLSSIGAQRLHQLLNGAKPESEAEQLLADNRDWLRVYLKHVIGEDSITINLGEPLPEWGQETGMAAQLPVNDPVPVAAKAAPATPTYKFDLEEK